MADFCLKVHPLIETQRKTQPFSARPKAESRVPSHLQSTVPWEPQVTAEWSCRTQAHSSNLHAGLASPLAMWLPGPEGLANTNQFVCKVGKTAVPSFPWIYICFPIWAKPTFFNTNFCMLWEDPLPPPNFFLPFSPAPTPRLTGFSIQHLPCPHSDLYGTCACLLLVSPPNRYQRG